MFEEIIFADDEVLSSERKFYDLAKSLLQVNTYEIEPSVELFEYLNVLNYVSSSDFASIDEFAEIWIKYMGPDIRVYYNEAYQNLKDLDLESQIQKVGGDLRKLNNIDDQQKISIRTMVEEIIFSDDEFTDEEKIVYELLLENLGIDPGIEYDQPTTNPLHWLGNIEQSQWFQNSINLLIVLTGIVVVIPTLFLGSLVTESFFGIPGLGSFTIDGIRAQDFSIVRSMVFLSSVLYILGLLLTDISYTIADPRVRLT